MGGVIALIVWLAWRATQGGAAIGLKWVWLLPFAAVLEAVSLLFYYLTVGQMVNLIPEILL